LASIRRLGKSLPLALDQLMVSFYLSMKWPHSLALSSPNSQMDRNQRLEKKDERRCEDLKAYLAFLEDL